jgi:hypothetical protein
MNAQQAREKLLNSVSCQRDASPNHPRYYLGWLLLKSKLIRSAGKTVEKSEPLHTIGGAGKMVQLRWEAVW